ncbi:hypothetical protein [Rhodococcoides trifolii]|uniref:hypothetical protein n=1 Tax=Rhodococcoides trifolii TaxID=908250 RepID=UPI00166473A1|nr:hypothetical protein [Rhodococcus trifolii]
MKKIQMSGVCASREAAAFAAYPSLGHAGWAPRTAGNAAFRVARLREADREFVSVSEHREHSR